MLVFFFWKREREIKLWESLLLDVSCIPGHAKIGDCSTSSAVLASYELMLCLDGGGTGGGEEDGGAHESTGKLHVERLRSSDE